MLAILDGRQPPELTLTVLMRPFAVEWRAQLLQQHERSSKKSPHRGLF
jgi:hypothetical protein